MHCVQELRQFIDRHPFKARCFSAAIGLPVVFCSIWLGSPWLSVILALIACLGAWELCQMARFAGKSPMTGIAVGSSFIIVGFVHVMVARIPFNIGWGFLFLMPIFLYFVWHIWRVCHRRSRLDWVITVAVPFYTGGLLAHGVMLRKFDEGMWWMMCAVLVTFSVDTLAYFGGKLIGRTSLAPTVSPGKTWEGAISGLAGGIVCAVLFVKVFDSSINFAQATLLGVLLGLTGQLGDLLESWLKRTARVKDSGWIIFGHGGVMDRIDSVGPNLAVMFYFIALVVQ